MAQIDKLRIANAALALIDRRGLEEFTIRAVARALGVTPMALYHHVKDKAELANLVLGAAIQQNPLSAPTGDWREDLWAQARWTREEALAHPALQELRRVYRIYTPEILRMAERWFSLWQQSGLAAEHAALAATTSSLAVIGLIAEESMFLAIEKPEAKKMAQLPNARLLFRTKHDFAVMFELAVRSVIDGLHTRLMSKPARKRPLRARKPQKS